MILNKIRQLLGIDEPEPTLVTIRHDRKEDVDAIKKKFNALFKSIGVDTSKVRYTTMPVFVYDKVADLVDPPRGDYFIPMRRPNPDFEMKSVFTYEDLSADELCEMVNMTIVGIVVYINDEGSLTYDKSNRIFPYIRLIDLDSERIQKLRKILSDE
jgi:hypothetical protein